MEGWGLRILARYDCRGGGAALLSNARSEVRGAVNCRATSQLREHLWDAGSSKKGECGCSSIKVQNDGSLALDQKQIGGRYVIN